MRSGRPVGRTSTRRPGFERPTLELGAPGFGDVRCGRVLAELQRADVGSDRPAVLRRDFRSVQGALLLMATTFVVVNLVVDVLYGFLDPRIREGYEEGR